MIGYTWDGVFYPGKELKPLQEFDWPSYRELMEESNQPRRLKLQLPAMPIECDIEPYQDLAFLLDQIPSVQVKINNGPLVLGQLRDPATSSLSLTTLLPNFSKRK